MREQDASEPGRNGFLIRRVRDELVYELYDPARPATDPPAGLVRLVQGARAGTAIVRSFGITAEHRGRGLARVLLTSLADVLRSRGYTRLYAAVPRSNERAAATVLRAGFSPSEPPAGAPRDETRCWFELELA